MNLGSVELREIVVTIGDQICEDRTTVNDVDTVSLILCVLSEVTFLIHSLTVCV